jgi:hypothetical protein
MAIALRSGLVFKYIRAFSFSKKSFALGGGVGTTPRRGGRDSNDFSKFLLSSESMKKALNEHALTNARIQTKPFSSARIAHAHARRHDTWTHP